ncbi:MAG: hypothetical protein EXR47_02560 [Dehalococcoidia bacterium]|nr:hypothetical protein [Dehalococcoidia bacterium]
MTPSLSNARPLACHPTVGARLRTPILCPRPAHLREGTAVSHTIAQRYVEAQARGWGRMGSGAVVQVQEEYAGTKLRL